MRFTRLASLSAILSLGFAAAALAQSSPVINEPGQPPDAGAPPDTALYGYGTPNYGGYYSGNALPDWSSVNGAPAFRNGAGYGSSYAPGYTYDYGAGYSGYPYNQNYGEIPAPYNYGYGEAPAPTYPPMYRSPY